jgi:hypothetical protein
MVTRRRTESLARSFFLKLLDLLFELVHAPAEGAYLAVLT